MLWLAIIVFVALLLVLVLVHEWGHMIAAKKAGCKVEEFGFGFPPRLFSKTWHGTRYSFNLIPLGGFVKIEGEDMQQTNPGPTSFASKSAGWRITILAAGVAMNMVLAVVFLAIQAGIGTPTAVTDENKDSLTNFQTYIVEVDETSPAAEAGLTDYDRVVRVGSLVSPTVEEFQAYVVERAGSAIDLEIERQGRHEILQITPRVNPPEGEGAIGVVLASTGLERVPWWQTPWEGIKRTAQLTVLMLGEFGRLAHRLATTGTAGEGLAGPVGIAALVKEATQLGASYVLQLGALISLNLALINILPLPALDGGRILFVILEKIVGRRFPGKIEQITHTIGFALLIFLMIVITFKDVRRLFS